ncbi:unnamed protein product [Cylicostephanus goldi]|uniref:Uncharacterized protein n=1 Tax=Cylicostephanus goldi TaxID=71465 RepID=A0A3P7N4J7_CYLGO|nr:unnamed protein product [Cylicostephanus goldi]
MGSKKKAKKNADFKKVKLKVGKKLKKTTTTDTTIQTKKVVLISQLEEKSESSEKPLSFRGLSLDELCKQLGHFNKSNTGTSFIPRILQGSQFFVVDYCYAVE